MAQWKVNFIINIRFLFNNLGLKIDQGQKPNPTKNVPQPSNNISKSRSNTFDTPNIQVQTNKGKNNNKKTSTTTTPVHDRIENNQPIIDLLNQDNNEVSELKRGWGTMLKLQQNWISLSPYS